MDAVLFRFPTKKMKGQGPIVQRVIARLVAQKTGGRFKVIPALYQFTGKHTYVMVVRKNANIEDIKGIPEINTELYTKVESDVGDVFINKKDGVQVSKETAIAGSIAAVEEKRTDKAVIRRTKISRRQVAASQALSSDTILDPAKFEEYEETAAQFSKPATAEMIPEAEEIKLSISSKAARKQSALLAASGISYRISNIIGITSFEAEKMEAGIVKELEKRIGSADLTSVESMQAFVQTGLDTLEEYKEAYIQKQIDNNFGSVEEKRKAAEIIWNVQRLRFIKGALQGYAKNVSQDIHHITLMRTPKQYTGAEKAGIKDYCGSGYHDINNMLLGRYDDESREILEADEVTKAIKNIDAAFVKGDRIPEGLTLWRAQTIRKPIYDAMVKNRVFYFRNFVSTSLMPIIFGGWKGNVGVAMTSDNTRNVLNIDKNGEESRFTTYTNADMGLTDEDSAQEDLRQAIETKIQVGWAIKGGHKINVVYPGDISNMANEMEIILPRGTMLQINKITDASHNDGLEYTNQKFVEAEIMTSDQLDESYVVYDGDVLMETGELVAMDQVEAEPVSFDSFVKSTRVGTNYLEVLASLIDINDMPEKFVES